MATLEQLTLNGAMTLLTYLQYSGLEHKQVGAEAIAATLCEMLTQLEAEFPGYAERYGWTKATSRSWETTSLQRVSQQHSLKQNVSR